MRNLALLAALAAVAAPALALVDPAASETYVLAAGATVLAEARYFDGLGTTKFSMVMWTGNTGGTTSRLESGAVCTEWHGTFTQVGIHAGAADNVELATYEVRGFAAAVPPLATGQGAGGYKLDLQGLPGFVAGNLNVCDHPGSFGAVSFTGTTAPMFLTQAPADPGLAAFEKEVA